MVAEGAPVHEAAATFTFLDIEASSLSADSFPIEVGWCLADGISKSYLIRSEADWEDWDPASEAVHGITRDKLAKERLPAAEVARLAYDALTGVVVSNVPEMDGF